MATDSYDSYQVAGLTEQVEILVDRWGIPHIYAASADDLFLAQGFNAARDRLFQLDLWRRRALGELSAAFGPSYVDQDRAARLLLYRGDMDAEWSAYGDDTKQIVTRFVAGVNAYVHWLEGHPDAMPPEFGMLGYAPARWKPEDVVRPRSHAPSFNLLYELYRARVAAASDVTTDLVRQQLERSHSPTVPDGLDLELPDDVLRDYLLATQSVQVVAADGAVEGSNNWVLAPSRTTTGRPMLASDPHRAYATPSLRYIAHLSAPGLDVIGAGEPALPGIALGHNGTAAFGFTIYTIDTEDLYVCSATTEPSETVTETIEVKDEDAREVELQFTRFGPVIYTDSKTDKLYVLRSTGSEPGTAPYLGSLDYLRARSWREFEDGLRTWRIPGENHVYADVEGTIAWKAAGLVPRRRGYDGLLPVAVDDDRFDWDGFLSAEEFPTMVDPAEGFIATANEFNVPDGLPAPALEWPDVSRQRRIVEVLSSRPRHSLADMTALQTDQLSYGAREILGCVRDLASDDPDTSSALALLRDWDAVESADSPAAALYEVWLTRHLAPAFVQTVVPAAAVRFIVLPDPRALRSALENPAAWFESDPVKVRDTLVLETLRQAYAEVAHLLGKDPGQWRWGDLHQNLQPHPLGHLDRSLDVGPGPVGGSGSTVNAASYWPEDFSPNIGASFRMVVDVGEWDNSVCVNTPGQSGDPRSPHYADLFEIWRRGEYVPMLYSRSAVEQNVAHRIVLEPSESRVDGL